MSSPVHSPRGQFLAILLSCLIVAVACHLPLGPPLPGSAGLPQYQKRGAVPVPGGVVNVAGGNLLLQQTFLVVDTLLGPQEVSAAYNSTSGSWLWNFNVSFDGSVFTDATGAQHDVVSLSPGDAIPGTTWVYLDAQSVKTKGGLIHQFDPLTNLLAGIRWSSAAYPRIGIVSEDIGGMHRISEIRQCWDGAPGGPQCESLFDIGYDANGVNQITDRAGRSATFSYDLSGRFAVAKDALDLAMGWPGFRYEYNGLLLTAVVNSEDVRIEYVYEPDSTRIAEVRQIGEENPVHRFVYDGINDTVFEYRTFHFDPLNNRTDYWYDSESRIARKVDVTLSEPTAWDWVGQRVIRETLPNGTFFDWTYSNDDPATMTQPSGNIVTFTYDPDATNRDAPFARPVTRVDDNVGLIEERDYDASGRLIAVRNGEGEETTYSYVPYGLCVGPGCESRESQGMLRRVDHPDGDAVELHEYGSHGHATLIKLVDSESVRVFDAVGNLIDGPPGLRVAYGGLLERTFDEDRNVTSITLADTTATGDVSAVDVITMAYRSDGKPTQINRPNGADHAFVYDTLGRLAMRRERADGVWRDTLFEYDARGWRTAVERPNGMRSELVFDAANRPTLNVLKRSGIEEGRAVFTYQNGQLTSLYDSIRNATELYAYDVAGRVQSIQFGSGEVLTFGYDGRSRLASEDYRLSGGAPRVVQYDHDLANRLVAVRDDFGSLVLQHIYQGGQRAETRYGNGFVRSYTYDPEKGRLTQADTVDSLLQTVETTTIDYALVLESPVRWEITASTTTFGATQTTTTERYGIGPFGDTGVDPNRDAGKRVFSWDNGTTSLPFAYDPLSNRTDAGSDSFVYNAERSRLLSADVNGSGTVNYQYDEAGYVISRAGETISWTASGRIASIGADVFSWDVLYRPISRTIGGVPRSWALFGGRLEGNDLVDLGEVELKLGTGDHRYRHDDFRGNVKFVSDSSGAILEHYEYRPYGVHIATQAAGESRSFVGQDDVGELMLLGARLYDPLVGRFLSPDAFLDAVNQYTYTLGNPVWFEDRLGLQAGGLSSDPGIRAVETTFGVIGLTAGFVGIFFVSAFPATVTLGVGLAVTSVVIGHTASVTLAALWVARIIEARGAVITEFPQDSGDANLVDSFPNDGGFSVGGGGGMSCGLLGVEVLPVLLAFWLQKRRRARLRGEPWPQCHVPLSQ